MKEVECIKCGKTSRNFSEDGIHPIDSALVFRSYGNFGSTVFDPLDGSYIDIVVCDTCMVEYAKKTGITEVESFEYEGENCYSIVGKNK